MKKLNAHEIYRYICRDILEPTLLENSLKVNKANIESYEFKGFSSVAISEVNKLSEWRSKYIRLNELFPNSIKNKDIREITKKLRNENILERYEWRESLFKKEPGPFISIHNVATAKRIVDNFIKLNCRNSSINISTIAKENKITVDKLKKVLKEEQIPSEKINNRIYVNSDQLSTKIDRENNLIKFEDMLEKYALEHHLILTESIINLVRSLMVTNDFYGLSYKSNNQLITVKDKRKTYFIDNSLESYESFSSSMIKICEKFIEKGNLKYFITLMSVKPNTYKAFQQFIEREKIKTQRYYNERQKKQILCLLITLPCELLDADEYIINEMLTRINNKNKILYNNMYNFIVYVAQNYNCNYHCANIYYMSTPVKRINVEPYPADIYIQIAYLAFNSECINSNKYIEKAINNSIFAHIWLYVAMHYFSMWRKGDILNLPSPIIEDNISILINKLREDTIDQSFYIRICDSIVEQSKTMVTNKTGKPLVLDIPLDLTDCVGKILLICKYHKSKDNRSKLIEQSSIENKENYEKFFGSEFTKVMEGKLFSNRRANKSYANAIAKKVENSVDKSNKIMGYMIASYARSHTGNIDSIAPSTIHYLDYRSDGLSADQFLMEMFSTGTCGFMLDVLLDWVLPNYNELNINNQTNLCKMLDLTPYEIDKRISGLTSLEDTTKNILDTCIDKIEYEQDVKSQIVSMVNNIANHNYTAKEQYVTCLRTAANKECIYKATDYCTTCEYALYGRMYIYELTKRMQECDYYIKSSKNKLVTQKEFKKLNALKSIFIALRQELSQRYQIKIGIINNILMGGDLDDPG